MKNQVNNVVNGVDVDRLVGTINAVTATPAIADFKFRNSNTWISGGLNRSTIQSFYGACQEDATRLSSFIMDNDEPDILLGSDKGANPVEYILHALAGCLTTTMVYHAAARGIRLEGVSSTYEGYLDLHGFLGLKPVPKGYQQLKIQFDIKGDFTQKEKEEIVKIGRKYSPVHDMMSKAVPNLEVTVVKN